MVDGTVKFVEKKMKKNEKMAVAIKWMAKFYILTQQKILSSIAIVSQPISKTSCRP